MLYGKRLERAIILINEIYREMYRQSEPPADYDELILKCKDASIGLNIDSPDFEIPQDCRFYNIHYLSSEKMDEIFDKFINENKKSLRLTKREIEQIHRHIWLGASPSSSKKHVEEKRKELKLD